jgi:hypothetical protein
MLHRIRPGWRLDSADMELRDWLAGAAGGPADAASREALLRTLAALLDCRSAPPAARRVAPRLLRRGPGRYQAAGAGLMICRTGADGRWKIEPSDGVHDVRLPALLTGRYGSPAHAAQMIATATANGWWRPAHMG